ncbi:DUF2199 domain-containing protein [Streptomyces sp. NPDC005918]|uniref:DUF2199 domain-containing protein n=1 Tax=Streptomyces sp. NPDC005918 TaxID=3155454 RepID=UPI00340D6F88
MADLWEGPHRAAEEAYFGWLSTELGPYSTSTINLKTHVHTRQVGRRQQYIRSFSRGRRQSVPSPMAPAVTLRARAPS